MFEELIPAVDFITFISSLVALLILIKNRRYPLKISTKIILALILILTLFHSFSNLLEWSGISSALDPYEDIIQIMEPLFWGFLFYSFLQGFKQWELMESEKRLREEKKITKLLLDLMTHDLINYNTVASGNMQLLLELVKSDEKLSELIFTSLRAIKENSMLVDNVKILHKLLEIGEKIPLEPISLTSVLESARKKVQSIYPSFSLKLNLTLDETDYVVTGHAIIENVFINLLTNSVRYRKVNQQVIDIDIDITHDEDYVSVTLSDYGRGVPDERKERIFDRFALSQQERKGSGLGLSISKRILEALDGKIWVENRADSPNDFSAGASFRILIKGE